ncbi:unnamed protein product [Rhizophagus irregularis]|nr:unnamed protein product [Rhizophagus irregularis]
MKNINSMNELIKEFEEIVMNESNIIRYGSTVALKHVATGKYLTSIEDLCYTTGSKKQLIYSGDPELNPNVLWKIIKNQSPADNNYSCTKTDIRLQHKISGQLLGIWLLPIIMMVKLNFYVVMMFNLLLEMILFQEVVCHNERLGGIDEWCIELIRQA